MCLDAGNAPFVPLKTATNFHLAFFQELIAVLPVVKNRIRSRGGMLRRLHPLACAILSTEAVQTLLLSRPVHRMALNTIDRTARQLVLTVQEYSIFAWNAMLNIFRPPVYWPEFLMQSDIIGVGSIAIVVLSGISTGGVLALQSAATLSAFGATAVTGQFVSLTMIRELGPVLTGIMVSGRNASSMASELGSMVVTEQIDAMRALGVDPLRKLVTPRIFASIAMLFFLTIVADACGIMGGGAVTVLMNHQNGTQYLNMAWEHLRAPDIVQGLIKPLFFGYILGSIGCFYGMRTSGGTQGVGRSTIQAVVTASVLIIFVDFLITHVLLTMFG
jgi:phospholipid/cholesterol/gamma-HCH transport system permease protein